MKIFKDVCNLSFIIIILIFSIYLVVITSCQNADTCRRMTKESGYTDVFEFSDNEFIALDKTGNVVLLTYSDIKNKLIGIEIIIERERICGDNLIEGTTE